MKKAAKIIFIIIGFLLMSNVIILSSSPVYAETQVRVSLLQEQKGINISSNTIFNLTDISVNMALTTGNPGEVWQITPDVSGIYITNGIFTTITPGPIVLSYAENSQSSLGTISLFQIGQQSYRESIEISRTPFGGLNIINQLDIEEYLYGVLPKEMPASWNIEALKAQAVAARTYTLKNLGKHKGQNFDVCNTVHCQVYGGYTGEKSSTNLAVDQTKGLVATYNGQLIDAVYHSTSGGHTEDSENIWGKKIPYLRGVVDFDQDSPEFAWTKTLSFGDFQKLLTQKGIIKGNLYSIEIVQKGVSGRVNKLTLDTENGKTDIVGSRLRDILGLRSTLFEIQLENPSVEDYDINVDQGQDVSVVDGNNTVSSTIIDENTKILGNNESSSDINALGTRVIPTKITFNGRGYGHGVGLSQWGAQGLAKKGYNFRQILEYYYQGTQLEEKTN